MTDFGLVEVEEESRLVEDEVPLRQLEERGASWAASAASSWFRPRYDGLLVGPSSAGKSSFLAALQPACEVPTTELELSLVPLTLPGDLAATGAANPTAAPGAYHFHLHIREQPAALGASPPEDGFSITLRDMSGRQLFDAGVDWRQPTTAVTEFLAEARTASWLVLMVDSLNPRPDLWRTRLPELAALLAQPRTDATVKIAGAVGRARPRGEAPPVELERRLFQQRVLVLLTKIDHFAGAALATLRESPELGLDPRLLAVAELSPERFAHRLDPVQMVQELLGGGLGVLRASLAPEAELAVGLVSAEGFHDEQLQGAVRQRPFGVREALAFLVTGRCVRPLVLVRSLSDLNPTHWSGRS